MPRKALGRGLDALIPNARELLDSAPPAEETDLEAADAEKTGTLPDSGEGEASEPRGREPSADGAVSAVGQAAPRSHAGGTATGATLSPELEAGLAIPAAVTAGLQVETAGAEPKRGIASGRASAVIEVPLDRIKPNPYQPREHFDDEETAELAASIRSKGVLQPVLLRRDGAGFQLIAGERRLRAARRADLSAVPAIVREVSDQEVIELALIENEQRVDLSPIESARSYERILSEFKLSQVELADVLGRDRSTVSNLLRLLRLPDRVQALVHEKRLSMGHARALVAVEDPVRCVGIAERAVRLGLPVRAVERLVQGAPRRRTTRQRHDPELYPFEERLRRRFATQVHIRRRMGRGRIEIEFYSAEDLERILEELAVLRET
jgi:ParB family chromosome partitioning protein